MIRRLFHLPGRLHDAINRSLAAKLLIPVALSALFVTGMYTYLISRMRHAWFMERMSLSQVGVREAVSNYFVESEGQHSAAQTSAFLAQLCNDTGLAQISLLTSPTPAASGGGALPQPVAATLYAPMADAPAPQAMSATATAWQSRLPLPSHRQCATCHAGQGELATIVMDFPKDQIKAMLVGDQYRLYGYAAAVLGLVLLIVLLILWVLVLEPLYRLSAAIARVHDGDLDAACHLDRDDQLGRVAEGFNDMLATLRLRHQEMRTGYELTIAHAERLATVGELASGLAHEIKNPLHSVSSALDIIGSRMPDPALKLVTRDIKTEIDRVGRIIHDLLRYARPTPAQQQRVDLPEVIDQTVRLLRPDAKTRHITLTVTASPDLPAVWVDPAKLHQVLVNLVLNAVQAGQPGGHVAVRLWHEPQAAQLVMDVDDDGPGIPADLQERIFEPFYTTRANGHGLGLSIARTLIGQQGGTIVLRPRPGPGACFRITLPVAPLNTAVPDLVVTDVAH